MDEDTFGTVDLSALDSIFATDAQTFYTSDGTLDENRTVNGGGFTLDFTNLDSVEIESTSFIAIDGDQIAIQQAGNEVILVNSDQDVKFRSNSQDSILVLDSTGTLHATAYGDTSILGTFTTILASDIDGNVIEVTTDQILGTDTDSTIYTHNGTLTTDRTMTGAGMDLTFENLDVFNITGDSVDIDATTVDMDGTNLTENYSSDITSTAGGTNTTSGADVAVNSTGGDVTVSSAGGDVVVNAGANTLNITADSAYVSEDLQLSAYGDTSITGTWTTILGSDIDGNVIEIRADEILATEPDSTIYTHNGTLTMDRTMTGANMDLTFENLDVFNITGDSVDIDATTVDMDGTNLTENYTSDITSTAGGTNTTIGNDVTSTATATNATSGANVTVTATGGNTTIGASSNVVVNATDTVSINSTDVIISDTLRMTAYGDTSITGTFTTILGSDIDGNIIEIRADQILGTETDSVIYRHDGTLIDNRTLSGGGFDLTFTGIGTLADSASTVISAATATNTTSGADVAVNSTGGDVTVSSAGGDVVVNAGANTLNITADSAYVSEDLQLSAYGDTSITGTWTTILGSDIDGNVIEIRADEILATEPDSTIYTHNGTLTMDRTMTGANMDLTFENLDVFNITGDSVDIDATTVDMDGTNLTENYTSDITSTAGGTNTTIGNDVTSTATATNATSGANVTVTATGGNTTIGASSNVVVNATDTVSINSTDVIISDTLRMTAYGDTSITGTFTTILGSDIDGNIIEIRADQILGTETDSVIYRHDGTLIDNRTLSGGGFDLTFTGIGTLADSASTVISAATATNTTSGADVAVNSTGGDVTVSSAGGDVVVNAGANTLNITADSAYVSEDLQLSAYGDTSITGTWTTILGSDIDGNVIEIRADEILATEPDSTIYTHNGTLTMDRTMTGANMDLTFENLDVFNITGDSVDIDATTVDMDGTNLTENYTSDITSTAGGTNTTIGNDVTSTATATNATSGANVTVTATGGNTTIGASSNVVVNATDTVSINSTDVIISDTLRMTAYGDTSITGTFTTILGSDIDGNIIEIRADQILGTETDSVIYRHDGTLIDNRTLSGGGFDLTFTGIGTLADSASTVISAATATNTTSGADVAVNSTGGDVTVSSAGGDVVVNAGANTLNITADSAYVSEDLQLSAYGDTSITGTWTTILGSDIDGNVIEIRADEILATEPDSTIYTHNGTLTTDRTMTGANMDLTFENLDVFNITGDSVDIDATTVDMDGTNLTENYTSDITSTAGGTNTTIGNDVTSTATATNATSGANVTVTATGGNTTIGASSNVVVNATDTVSINSTDVIISDTLRMTAYGDTSITGTFTTILGSDIDGNVIEIRADEILGTQTDSVIYRHNGTLISERTMTMAGFNLNFVDGTDTTVIANNGRVAIGTGTFTPDSGQSQVKLEVNGDILAVRVHSSSDKRFKKNINPIESALQKVMSIEGVTYDFRTDEFTSRNFPTSSQVGFIAQNVESVLPEVVRTNGDGFKAVDYAKMTALLNEAIKEQQMLIEQLNKELHVSKTQNQYLAGEIASIKEMLKKNSNLAISDED